jgi:hypothetical protein
MAASYGTAIAVQQGGKMEKQLTQETEEALRQLNVPEEEIAALAEKNKALPPEENVVEKEDATPEGTPEKSTLWTALGELLGVGSKQVAPDASEPEEARKTDEVTEPAKTAEPAEKAEGDEPEETQAEQTDPSEMLKALAQAVSIPLAEAMKVELDKRDERINALETQVAGLNVSVEEKVEERLRNVPEVVTVAASQVAATAAPGTQPVTKGNAQLAELMDGIKQATKDTLGGRKFQA